MTATTAQTAQTTAKAPVQIGKGKEEVSTNGFANLLADTISKSSKGIKAAVAKPQLDIPMLDIPTESKKSKAPLIGEDTKSKRPIIGESGKSRSLLIGEHEKGKGLLGELDLSHLGELETEDADGKKGAVKLADILAELSHKSEAPVGSEVINLKTVLSSKNDDPDLINKDLLGLVAPKDRKKVMRSLITGAKQLLTDQLEARIPKNRVPKTLKGLLETAIRFNMVVTDVKLENLPESKVTKELLQLLDTKAKKERPLPVLGAKVALGDKQVQVDDVKSVIAEKSPLEKMLKAQEPIKTVSEVAAKEQ
jgi:hypothetical protein